jgi:hypothetical protein
MPAGARTGRTLSGISPFCNRTRHRSVNGLRARVSPWNIYLWWPFSCSFHFFFSFPLRRVRWPTPLPGEAWIHRVSTVRSGRLPDFTVSAPRIHHQTLMGLLADHSVAVYSCPRLYPRQPPFGHNAPTIAYDRSRAAQTTQPGPEPCLKEIARPDRSNTHASKEAAQGTISS